MEVLEGRSFRIRAEDRRFLSEKLGGYLERREGGWAVTRVVGHVRLPSGPTLRIRSSKATSASVLAWMAYVDPSLKSLRFLGRLPEGAGAGDLSALVARLFLLELLGTAMRQGLVRRYYRVGVRSSTVRGAIDFARLTRQGGDLSRMPCRVWERLPETPLNRFLAAVIERIRRDAVMREAGRAELPQALALFGGVRASVPASIMSGKVPLPRNEQAFETAVALGRVILQSAAMAEGDDRAGISFLVNLESLFERTIGVAFREAGIDTQTKAPVRYALFDHDSEGVRNMEMDVYCPSLPSGPLVVDAKYKTNVSSANLQQMVTYCFATGSQRAVLVLPEGHLSDKRSYRFSGGRDRAGDTIRIDVEELATDATDVVGWRENAARMVSAIVGN